MDQAEVGALLQNLDRRLERVEQKLPTLVTKDELQAVVARLATRAELEAAIAPLATRAELEAAIAPLATRAEVREEGERTRRHFDIVAERLRDDIRLIAEAQVAADAKIDRHHREHLQLAQRVTTLEMQHRPRKR